MTRLRITAIASRFEQVGHSTLVPLITRQSIELPCQLGTASSMTAGAGTLEQLAGPSLVSRHPPPCSVELSEPGAPFDGAVLTSLLVQLDRIGKIDSHPSTLVV